MGRLINIGISSLLSGGILSHGTLSGYVSDAARRALGMGLAHFKDGTVHYLGKDVDLLGRCLLYTSVADNFRWLEPVLFTGFASTRLFRLAGAVTNLAVAF